MFSTLRKWSWILLVVRSVFNILGTQARRQGWVVCDENGTAWKIVDESGKYFLVGHVVALMLVCVMTETLFGTAALKSGLLKIEKAKEEKK